MPDWMQITILVPPSADSDVVDVQKTVLDTLIKGFRFTTEFEDEWRTEIGMRMSIAPCPDPGE